MSSTWARARNLRPCRPTFLARGLNARVEQVWPRKFAPCSPPDDAFDRVISVSQYEMMEAAQIRRSLGIEGVSPEQVHIVNDKVAMKAAVAGCGLRVPRFVRCDEALTASSADVTPWAGKTVLKPLDGTASKDVFVFATYADAGTAILNHPTGLEDWDPERFQLEEYVEGPIFHFDGVMLAGAPVAIVASRYLGTCLEFAQGVPQGSIQVDDDGGRCKVAVEYLRAVGIDNGPFHLEMIEAADGMVFLEVGARPGGGHIKETFRLATGIDLVAAGLACNLDWSPLEINPLKRCSKVRRAVRSTGISCSRVTCFRRGTARYRVENGFRPTQTLFDGRSWMRALLFRRP